MIHFTLQVCFSRCEGLIQHLMLLFSMRATKLQTIKFCAIIQPMFSNSRPSSSTVSASAHEVLRLDNQLCFELYSASLAMTKLYQPLLAQLGLTYPQYLVMLVLWEQDDVTVSDIGQRLGLDSGTLTPLLKRLAQQGMLMRERDMQDERRVRVRLSAAGLALREQAALIPRCILQATQCSLSEVQALAAQVRALRANIHTALQKPQDFSPSVH
jgi:MarR family transcriptional regulator, organic hydroperoxide resistance regulator